MTDPFTNLATLYANRTALTINYQPETVVERNSEIQELANALNGVRQGWAPDNIIVYGKTGVGKTAVTNHVLDILETHVELTRVQVTCSTASSYRTAITIVNQLRADTSRDRLPERGLAEDQVYDALYDELDTRDQPAVIVMDEIDNLSDDDKILYELPRARAKGHLNGDTYVGVIGISNDFTYRENLSPKVKDSLAEKEVHFQPYNAPQLQSILSDRVGIALKDEKVLDDGVIPLCAGLASKDHGSARQAIELLKETIDIANERGHSKITEGHVNDARNRVDKNQIRDAVSNLTDHTLFSLIALGYESEARNKAVRRKHIYERYTKLANLNSVDALGYRSVCDHLDELALEGFAEKRTVNRGEGGGRFYEYESSYPYETITDAVREHYDWAFFNPDSSERQMELNV